MRTLVMSLGILAFLHCGKEANAQSMPATTQYTYTGNAFGDCHPTYGPYVQCLPGRVAATIVFNRVIDDSFTGTLEPSSVTFQASGVTLNWPTSPETTYLYDYDGVGFVNGKIVKYRLTVKDALDFFGYSIGIANSGVLVVDSIEATRFFAAPTPHYETGVVGFTRTPGTFVKGAAAPVSCASLINGGIGPPDTSDSTVMHGSFKPNGGISLADAAKACGFAKFNWVQYVVHLPDPSPFCQKNPGNLPTPDPFPFCGDNPLPYNAIHVTSRWTPFNDPPPDGYTYGYYTDAYPYFYPTAKLESVCASSQFLAAGDPRCSVRAVDVAGTTLSLWDQPVDPCIPYPYFFPIIGPPCGYVATALGEFLGFETHLAGVKSDGRPFDLGMGYRWTSDVRGIGTANPTLAAAAGNPTDDPTGRVTVTEILNRTTYDYPNREAPGEASLSLLQGNAVTTTTSVLTPSRATGDYVMNVLVKNTSDKPIGVPLQLSLRGLPDRVIVLNSAGTFGGYPYVTIPSATVLGPQQSLSVVIRFTNPFNLPVSFTPMVYSGTFQ